jgi:hypothetical protein
LVTPALFYTFGRKLYEHGLPPSDDHAVAERLAASFTAPTLERDGTRAVGIDPKGNGTGPEPGARTVTT